MLNAQPAWFRLLTFRKLVWAEAKREVHPEATLHPTVLERLAAPRVPQMGEVRPYRPESLSGHVAAKDFYGTNWSFAGAVGATTSANDAAPTDAGGADPMTS